MRDKKDIKKRRRMSSGPRHQRSINRFVLPKDAVIEYKNVSLLQKFVNDRGKITPRRISGLSAKNQRQLVVSINRARFLALLPVGGVKK